MQPVSETRRENLHIVIRDYFPSGRQLALRIGVHPNSISRISNNNPADGRNMGDEMARSIEREAGLPAGWMDVEHPELRGRNEPLQIHSIKQSQSVSAAAISSNIPTKKDWVSIPKLNVSASMGKGLSSQCLESVVEEIIVERDWLRRNVNATAPGNLALITAYGDSMEGTFNDGDLLLVDRGVESVNIDAVYVLALGDELFIKRLQRRPDGSILMLSDNSKYAAYEISDGDLVTFRVLGRVLLAWNVRRL